MRSCWKLGPEIDRHGHVTRFEEADELPDGLYKPAARSPGTIINLFYSYSCT